MVAVRKHLKDFADADVAVQFAWMFGGGGSVEPERATFAGIDAPAEKCFDLVSEFGCLNDGAKFFLGAFLAVEHPFHVAGMFRRMLFQSRW